MEYRVHYYEPGLGWCLLIDPHPEGTVYRSLEEGIAAADRCLARLNRSVQVWECGYNGCKEVYENMAQPES